MNTGFGNTEPRIFFKIKDGKIVVKDLETSQNAFYSFFAGFLDSITYVEKEILLNGKTQLMKSYNVSFKDKDNHVYIWSPSPTASLFQGFINSLCSLDNFDNTIIQLQPYVKDGQQRLSIQYSKQTYSDSPQKWERLNWKYKYIELPTIKPIVDSKNKPVKDANGHVVYDFEDRLNWIAERVAEINKKVSESTMDALEPIEDENTEDDLDNIPF
ncbi:MAG: hypothetical protein ABFD00_03810 [Chloroherpetonaceae bacterium]